MLRIFVVVVTGPASSSDNASPSLSYIRPGLGPGDVCLTDEIICRDNKHFDHKIFTLRIVGVVIVLYLERIS